MICSRSVTAAAALFVSVSVLPIFADAGDAGSSTTGVQNLARSAEIECITPDGRVTRITPVAPESGEAAALIKDDDTVSCSLQEGETDFVIAVTNAALLDRLTFLNENVSARGELTIAVSNSPLPAKSPKWIPVEGVIRFEHKRAFDLSMLGVEAKFVRLSFRVEKQPRLAAIGF